LARGLGGWGDVLRRGTLTDIRTETVEEGRLEAAPAQDFAIALP
jgi:hypothetical protein